jgi:curli biogenesis system outer membrane secretion channel CsgG
VTPSLTRRVSGPSELVPASAATAAVATTAATATSAAVAASATTTTATAATTATLFAGASFVDRQGTALVLLVVQALDSSAGGVIVAHFHKAKAFAPARVAVHDHLRATDRSELGEELFEALVRAKKELELTAASIHNCI